MRVSAALDAFVSVLAISLVVIVAALTLSKVVPGWSPRWTRDVLMAAPFAIFATTLRAFARKLVPLSGAMALDAHHGLSDRVTSALSFAALPDETRSPLMEVAIDDACELSEKLTPRKAAPIAMPRDTWALAGLSAGVLLVSLIDVRIARPVAQAKTIDPVVLSADDIDLFRGVGKKLAETDKNPEVL